MKLGLAAAIKCICIFLVIEIFFNPQWPKVDFAKINVLVYVIIHTSPSERGVELPPFSTIYIHYPKIHNMD
jgi:hypothetical protein